MSENSIPSSIEYSKEAWREYMRALANSKKSNNNKFNSSTCSVISLDKLSQFSDGNPTSSKVKAIDTNTTHSITAPLIDVEMNDNISEQNENNNLTTSNNSIEEISVGNNQIPIAHKTTNHDNDHKFSKSFESNNGNKQTKTDNYNHFETTHSHDYKNPRKEDPKPYESRQLMLLTVPRTPEKKESFKQNSSHEQNNYSEINKRIRQNSYSEQNNFSEINKRIKQIIPCLKGLVNHGNTCYFNAFMQCLANCESFAQFLLCNNFVFSNENELFYSFVQTIRSIWFNNSNVDYYCRDTVKLVGKMNSDFVFGSQHDSHECMIWLLNKIQTNLVIEVENKISYYSSNNYDFQNHRVGTSRYMSNDRLPSLQHKDEDSILNLFRCTLRHEIKCMNCDFIQTSLEPCLSVSLSVPSPRKININFISLYPKREMTCFSCQIFDNSLTVKNLKDQIMNEVKNVSSKNMIAYLFKPTGLSQFLKDDSFIDKKFNELAIFEIPEQSNLPPNYISSIVIFVIGDFPNGKIIRIPFVASLNDALNYRQLCFELLKEGNFLLPRPYYKMTQNFKIILQTSDNSGIKGFKINSERPLCLNGQSLPESEHGNILRIIVEWDLSLKAEFENMNYNLINRNKSFNNQIDLKPIPLINLIDNFVKIEPIENWECDKCGKESGYIKICFDSMPDILVFYLKRFATSNYTKKNDRNVAIPFEGLNLDKYVFKGFNNIYNLTGVIYHQGGTIRSGHYTSANKNCVDHQWRLFNDLSVSSLNATNNITISSNSYMLFYQKQTSFPWFPENIPKNIIEYYFDEVKPHNQSNNRSGKNDGRTNNGSKDGITSYRRLLSWLLGCLLRLFHR